MMMLHTNMFSKERGNLTYYLDTWTHHVDLLQGMTETEKLFIRNGPWMVSAPRLCLGSFWGAAGQHGPKLSQHICSASVLDSCKFRESGHIPFWFTGSDSTVREHKEYYYFLDHLTEMSAIPLCTSVAMWPMWDLQEDVGFPERCVHAGCAARRSPCCGPGAEAAVAEGPTSSLSVRLCGGAVSVQWGMAGGFH